MKIVIVGGGKIGKSLTAQLTADGHDITVIEREGKELEKLLHSYDIMGIAGNGANADVQREAGVATAGLLIAVTPSDEMNILCCLVAKKLGARHIVARVRDPEYFNLFLSDELGLDMMVNPEYEAAMEIAGILRLPYASKAVRFAEEKLELVEFRLRSEHCLSGKTLREIPTLLQSNILISAVERGTEVMIPQGDFTLKADDRIYISAAPSEIQRFFRELNGKKKKIKHVTVLGGNRIAFYLARELLKAGLAVKLIDDDEKNCDYLADALPKAEIICGNGYDRELLREEQAERTDAAVVLSDDDEDNIIIALFFAGLQIKVVARMDNELYTPMLKNGGVDSIITPKSIASDEIVRYIRSLSDTDGGDVKALYKVFANRAEILEYAVNETFDRAGISLKELKRGRGVLIIGILREGKLIVPCGEDVILLGDRVVIMTTQTQLRDLNDILV